MPFSPEEAEVAIRRELEARVANRRLATGEEPTLEELAVLGDDHLPPADAPVAPEHTVDHHEV